MYDPSRVTVIAVGDASHEELAALIEAAFGQWRTHGPSADVCPDPASLPIVPAGDGRSGRSFRGRRRRSRSCGSVIWRVPRNTPDYHALVALNMVLGGQFVSRINMNLRERKGYTYGARTSFEFRRGPGPFVVARQRAVGRDRGCGSRGASRSSKRSAATRPVTLEELELGRARADARLSSRNFETAEQIAPRDRAAGALRPARRLLHDVRAHACWRSRPTISTRPPRHTSIPSRLRDGDRGRSASKDWTARRPRTSASRCRGPRRA